MMRAHALLCAALIVACATPAANAADRSTSKRISTADKQLEQTRLSRQWIRSESQNGPRDLRGVRKIDDIERWTFGDDFERRVESSLTNARKAEKTEAGTILDDAERDIRDTTARARQIAAYWNSVGSTTWRDILKNFATKNGLEEVTPPPDMIKIEAALLEQLERGDFGRALPLNQQLNVLLGSIMQRMSMEVFAAKFPDGFTFIPRRTPCPSAGPADGSASARMTDAASPVDYYPAESKRLKEEGAITVIARVMPSNCASEFAIVESSGFPKLDAAALEVAEASRYAAATENGVPVESQLIFKVKFVLH